MIFSISGHTNLLATHQNTLEFTKDKELTKKGNCVVGIRADFDYNKLMKIAQNYSKIKVIIKIDKLTEEIICKINNFRRKQ